LDAAAELNGQENWVFNLMADVGRSDVVVESLRVVPDHHLPLALALVLPLYELLLYILITEGLHE
jgi:hypothetical protein